MIPFGVRDVLTGSDPITSGERDPLEPGRAMLNRSVPELVNVRTGD